MNTIFGSTRSLVATRRALTSAASVATLLLVLPGHAWAEAHTRQSTTPTAPATHVSVLPHSLADVAPLFEQHSRGGGGGGGGGRRDSGGSGGSGGQAVPRGGSSGGSSSGGSSSGGSSGGSSSGGSSGGNSGATATGDGARTRAGSGSSGGSTADTGGSSGTSGTPTYSKPRDGRPEAGTAVARGNGRRGGTTTVTGGGYYGGFYPWGWGGFGLGGYYGYYDPWGWDDPYQPVVAYDHDGSLKLKVTPRQAEVYVDGYFAGAVDDYDGVFQKLQLDPGPHRIEVRLDGYEPLTFDVRIEPGRTVTFKGELQKRGEDDDTGN